jgi:hypothetical protein
VCELGADGTEPFRAPALGHPDHEQARTFGRGDDTARLDEHRFGRDPGELLDDQ